MKAGEIETVVDWDRFCQAWRALQKAAVNMMGFLLVWWIPEPPPPPLLLYSPSIGGRAKQN